MVKIVFHKGEKIQKRKGYLSWWIFHNNFWFIRRMKKSFWKILNTKFKINTLCSIHMTIIVTLNCLKTITFFVACLKMYLYFVDFLRNGYEVLISDGFTFSATSDGKVAHSIKLAMFKTDLSIFSAYCSLYCKKSHNYFEIYIHSIVKNQDSLFYY